MSTEKHPISGRRCRARPFTPPPDLAHTANLTAPQTPARAGVFWAKVFSQKLGIPIPKRIVREATGVSERSQSRIIQSNRIRTLHKDPNSGPDPRGRKPALLRTDTAAIADYLDDSTIPLEARGAPWIDIATEANIQLPETFHFNPPGKRTVNPRTIQHACRQDEGIINAICEEEKELDSRQALNRIRWADTQLEERPSSKDWKDTAVCDELHFGIGPQITKRIKRKVGKQYRYKPENVHRKKVTSKDTKAKAREDGHLKLLNVFVIISYNWRKFLTYQVPNTVGKMTTKVYTQEILPQILPDLLNRGLTLIQDADSAHTSKGTIKWAKDHNLKLLTLPGGSPDFSILESMAFPLKRKFHTRRCISEKGALDWFNHIFYKELDMCKVREMYNWFIKRLYEAKRAKGQMTRY